MTGKITEYNGMTKRGTIQPSDGSFPLEFEQRDVLEGEAAVGAVVKFNMQVGSAGGQSAREIEVISADDPCPCGSGNPYSQCHAPEASTREVRMGGPRV